MGMDVVALPTEGVDRNRPTPLLACTPTLVALPTEGVDRNGEGITGETLDRVALPTEGVDRNC